LPYAIYFDNPVAHKQPARVGILFRVVPRNKAMVIDALYNETRVLFVDLDAKRKETRLLDDKNCGKLFVKCYSFAVIHALFWGRWLA
jgi:hypothetical protein